MRIALVLIISCFSIMGPWLPGKAQELSKPTIIDFQASWCEPCRELQHLLRRVERKYADKLKVVSIDVDDPANQVLVEKYGVKTLPTVVFLSADGKLSGVSTGFFGETTLDWGLKTIMTKRRNR